MDPKSEEAPLNKVDRVLNLQDLCCVLYKGIDDDLIDYAEELHDLDIYKGKSEWWSFVIADATPDTCVCFLTMEWSKREGFVEAATKKKRFELEREGWNKALQEQELTRIMKSKAKGQKDWLQGKGIDPAKNEEGRTIQIREEMKL